jgi:hypothetical protein
VASYRPKVNLPGYVKAFAMGKENRYLRILFCEAIRYSDNGRKKVASADAKLKAKTDKASVEEVQV